MARSLLKRGLAEGLTLPTIEKYEPEEIKPEIIETPVPEEVIYKEDPVQAAEETAAEIPQQEAENEEPVKQQSRRGRKPGSLNKPKPTGDKPEEREERAVESTRAGLAKGWKRNTFVFHEDNLELLRCYAFENRMKEKDVINQALNEFFERHPVKMK